jgi:hypothetical protein
MFCEMKAHAEIDRRGSNYGAERSGAIRRGVPAILGQDCVAGGEISAGADILKAVGPALVAL